MQNVVLLYEAVTKLQEREKQAPSSTAKVIFERTQEALQSELDEADYFYLAAFAEALILAKKFNTARDLPFEHLGLFAHALSEFSSKAS
ncbi:hypothetical protein [Pasteurella multocida]|uniref:hypothetical protein n=1 Tax=Pasteurella multocida TaxID=747 RepID=UPI00111998F1|nr:hypothetical protein [Pasteurella multocida]QDA24780.1 hypothetical protein FHZ86_08465 [Pasteurella multocida]QDB93165.1 hypothetical protein FH580_08465 [Pasteurella multocida]